MKINHINICAPLNLLNTVRDFYCELFDLKVGDRPNFERAGYWLYFDCEPLIHLTVSSKHYKNEKQGYFDHVAFSVYDISLLTEKLKSLNVAFDMDTCPETNVTQVFFKDPCGLGVEASGIMLV